MKFFAHPCLEHLVLMPIGRNCQYIGKFDLAFAAGTWAQIDLTVDIDSRKLDLGIGDEDAAKLLKSMKEMGDSYNSLTLS